MISYLLLAFSDLDKRKNKLQYVTRVFTSIWVT